LLQAFVFNEIAIIVRHWFEIGADGNEHGTRVEIRRLVSHEHRGSESAPQLIEIDGIVWRADLFDSLSDEPGNFARAHHHMQFDGLEPLGRDWDDRLGADPFGWLEEQLGALPSSFQRAVPQFMTPRARPPMSVATCRQSCPRHASARPPSDAELELARQAELI
jgi:hypothetical protein